MSMGGVAPDENDETFLTPLLDESKPRAQFASGFARGRILKRGWEWIEQLKLLAWPVERVVRLFVALPFCEDAWRRVERLSPEVSAKYWRATPANPFEVSKSLEIAVDRLIENGRPAAAVRCLHRMQKDSFDGKRVVQALLAMLNSGEPPQELDGLAITELIERLQRDKDTNPDDLFKIEWAYLAVLDSREGPAPLTLERKLATEPDFFCDVVRIVFKSKIPERREKEDLSDDRKRLAENGYRLLQAWRMFPGSRSDKTLDGSAFTAWLSAVKVACTESGHLEIAMTMIGHLLRYAPPDPSGLWIHKAVAEALNAKDGEDLRNGLRTEFMNSRGVFSFSGGKQEREIASRYRGMADAAEAAGFHRLATSMRDLATDYDRQAEREAARDPED